MIIVVFKDLETVEKFDAGLPIPKEDRTLTGIVFMASTPEEGRAQALTLKYYQQNPDKAQLMRCIVGTPEECEEVADELM
jgi:hypothetical protein